MENTNNDMINLAKMTATQMQNDKVVDVYMKLYESKSDKLHDFLLSYVQAALKKMEKLQTLYMTNPAYKEHLTNTVLGMLK
jgi:hypothetical protein